MTKKDKIPPKNFADFKGTFYLPAAMYRAGDYLSKGTKKRVITVGLVAGGTTISQAFSDGVDWASVWGAVANTGLITTAVCTSAFIGGLAMKGKAQGKMDRDALDEEARGSNLTEDMKKRFHEDHKQLLWERVGKYEQSYYPEQTVRNLEEEVNKNFNSLIHLVNPLDESVKGTVENKEELMKLLKNSRITEKGFGLCFDYCFHNNLNQNIEANHTGLNFMQFVEDFYDGGFLHSTGNKTYEVWSANPSIQEAKTLGKWNKKEEFKKLIQARWVPSGEKMYDRITTAVSFRRAYWDNMMRDKYGLEFSLSDYLEKSEELDSILFEQISAQKGTQVGHQIVRDFNAGRRFVVGQTLHYGYDDAMRKMDKAQLPAFLNATNLRGRLDPKYAAGVLNGDSLEGDLAELNAQRYYSQKVSIPRQVEDAATVLEHLPFIIESLGYENMNSRNEDMVATILSANKKVTLPVMKSGKYKRLKKMVHHGINQRQRYHSALENVRTLQTLTMADSQITRHYLQPILA